MFIIDIFLDPGRATSRGRSGAAGQQAGEMPGGRDAGRTRCQADEMPGGRDARRTRCRAGEMPGGREGCGCT